MRLSDEQKAFYRDNGYLVLRGLFPRAEAESMRRRLLDVLKKPRPGSKRLSIGYEQKSAGRDPRKVV